MRDFAAEGNRCDSGNACQRRRASDRLQGSN
jgi:hypothetical protein